MDAIVQLARHVITTQYDSLPHEVIKATKRGVLDTIGTVIAGASASGCEAVVNLVKGWGGVPESTILVHGGKVPAHNAALVNSMMARALDYDNAMRKGMHPSASSVPTALAVAEMCGGTSGKEFLTTIAVGEDVAARINLATTTRGFDHSSICGIFGTTAIAGRILKLSQDEMLNALGLALNLTSGSLQSVIDKTLAIRLSQGFTSSLGILSAMLAQKGITGPKDVLEGLFGYFHLYSQDNGDMSALTEGLGKRFEVIKFLFKRFPSCGNTLAATDAVLELSGEYDIEYQQVAEITVHLSQRSYDLCGQQFKIGYNPEVYAQFSVPYTVANALVRRSSRLEHFTERFATDPEVLDMARKVHLVVDSEVEKEGSPQSQLVEIRMKNGDSYSKYVKYPKGFSYNPLSDEELKEKFTYCVSVAPKPLPQGNTEQIIGMVEKLEELSDVTEMVSLLVSNP